MTRSAFVSDDELIARIEAVGGRLRAMRAEVANERARITDDLTRVLQTLRLRDGRRLNSALAAAYDLGYTLDELGLMIGITREGVRQKIAAGDTPPRPPVLLSDAEEAELHRAHAAADGRNPAKRAATEAYRQLLRHHADAGVSQSYLARLLGLTPAAVGHQVRRVDADPENTKED